MTADHSLDQPDLLVSAAGLSAAHTRMREDEAAMPAALADRSKIARNRNGILHDRYVHITTRQDGQRVQSRR